MMTFSQIKYERVDLQDLKDQIAELTRRLKEAADFAQAEQAYLQMNELEGQAMHGMRTVAQIRRDIDTRDEFYDAEIKFYNRELPLVQPLKQAWTNELLRSPFRKELEQKYGEVPEFGASEPDLQAGAGGGSAARERAGQPLHQAHRLGPDPL